MRGQEARDQAERKAAMATLAQSSGDDIVRLWNEAGLPSRSRTAARSRDRPGHRARPHRRRRRAVQCRRGDRHPRHGPAAVRTGRPLLCARPRQAEGASWRPSPTRCGRTRPDRAEIETRVIAPLQAALADGRMKSAAPRRRQRRWISSPWFAEKTDGYRSAIDRGRFRRSGVQRPDRVPRRDGRDGAAGQRAAAAGLCPPAGAALGNRRRRSAGAVRQRHAAVARPGSAGLGGGQILAWFPHRRAAGQHAGRRAFRA